MRIFQTLYFSALTVMTLVPSAKADRAQELVEQFCHAHAEICEQFADQKPLLETYLVGYEFEASHALEKSQIPPAFQDVDPLDIAPLLKNVFRIARTAPHPKENTERIAQWVADATVAALSSENKSYLEWMDTLGRLKARDWDSLANFIMDYGPGRSWKKTRSFRKFTVELMKAPKSLLTQLKAFQDLEGKTRWPEFTEWTSEDEYISLAQQLIRANLANSTEIWGNHYVEFLSDSHESRPKWSVTDLYEKHFVPRVAKYSWPELYPEQKNDRGKLARISFSPYKSRRQTVEGKIVNIKDLKVQIATAKGKVFIFDQNEGKFEHFFVEEPELNESYSDYLKRLQEFYRSSGRELDLCSFYLE